MTRILPKKFPIISCLWLVFVAYSSLTGLEAQEICVGSQSSYESRFLAEVLAQTLETQTTFKVKRLYNLGQSKDCLRAAREGRIQLYPEYTDQAQILLGLEPHTQALRAWSNTVEGFEREYSLTWLMPFGFDRKMTLAASKTLGSASELKTISDLRRIQKHFRVAVPQRALQSKEPWEELKKHYELSGESFVLDEHDSPLTAVNKKGGDLVFVSSTDGRLNGSGLTLLKDDQNFFPSSFAAPVLSKELLQKYPQLREHLSALAYEIKLDKIKALNGMAEIEKRPIEQIAKDFLNELNGRAKSSQDHGFSRYWQVFFRQQTLRFTLDHLKLTALSTIFACLIGLPLGVWLCYNRIAARICLSLAALLQTIPSLALLALLIPLAGLGGGAALSALVLYALLPIMRNTYTGILNIDPALIKAARGIGLTEIETLQKIRLPLAVRGILSGIRISAVISVRVAAVAAFIGAGGLGEPILLGLQLNDPAMVISGAVPAALMALSLDWILGLIEKKFSPNYESQSKNSD